jgi:alkylglycerol monooxygenase
VGGAAGTLIIWDRMFGTFQEEKDDERVVYGLTHPLNTFDPFWVQFHHLIHVLRTAWTIPGLGNKLSVLFKGPGWAPGKPRLGDLRDVPAVRYPHKYYDPKIPGILTAYIMVRRPARL